MLNLVKPREYQIIPGVREAFFRMKQLYACLTRACSRESGSMRIELRVNDLTSDFFYLFAEDRNHLEKVSDDTIVRHIEDGCFRVFINGQNHF